MMMMMTIKEFNSTIIAVNPERVMFPEPSLLVVGKVGGLRDEKCAGVCVKIMWSLKTRIEKSFFYSISYSWSNLKLPIDCYTARLIQFYSVWVIWIWISSLLRKLQWATKVLRHWTHFSPSPPNNVDFSISSTAQTTASTQHWIGGPGVSEN